MRSPLAKRARGAFTLVEMSIAIALLGIVIANVYMVLGSSSEAFSAQTTVYETDTSVRRALDRIALLVVGAERNTLYQAPTAPSSTPEINFTQSLGMQDGEVVFGNPQRIALTEDESDRGVTWFENPGAPNERRSVFTRFVKDYLDGEVQNGIDDNGNGVIDERGLNFVLEGALVIIQLTIERQAPDGTWITRTYEARVTCRN